MQQPTAPQLRPLASLNLARDLSLAERVTALGHLATALAVLRALPRDLQARAPGLTEHLEHGLDTYADLAEGLEHVDAETLLAQLPEVDRSSLLAYAFVADPEDEVVTNLSWSGANLVAGTRMYKAQAGGDMTIRTLQTALWHLCNALKALGGMELLAATWARVKK